MILVLTYHKVLREPETSPEFYNVTAQQLDRHLELLVENGFRPAAPDELLKKTPPAGRPFVLTFDDATEDHHDVVLPVLERHGCRAIFFVPTSKLNRPGYLTSEQTRAIGRAGHTLGFHSHEHRRLDQFSEEDIRVQLELSHRMIADLSAAPPRFFAPPGGFMSRRIHQLAVETGAEVIRTMRWGYNWKPDLTRLECMPVNRHLTDPEFRRILKLRSSAFFYTAKQTAKKLMPARSYESLRNGVFRLLGRN